jgi:hypothetical protein
MTPGFPQAAGGVQGSAPRFQVIRSVSGSAGSQINGTYVISDPRSTFYLGSDKQVIVYFEWQGPLGMHHLEGYWKSPDGKTTLVSNFDYESKQPRFGGYWVLNLTDATEPGVWTLEAHVDGEVTGVHTFQIASSGNAPPVSERTVVTPAEIYKRGLSSTLTIQKISAKGQTAASGSGFVLKDGLIVTTFGVVDGASALRLQFPNGNETEVHELASWSRWQDWALIRANTSGLKPVALAKAGSWQVGDRCFFLDAPEGGNRTIVDGNITGEKNYPRAGDRLNTSFAPAASAIGSPLFNEYGEVIGLVGGTSIPGMASLQNRAMHVYDFSNLVLSARNLVVPLSLVSIPPANGKDSSLAELAQSGQFIAPVSAGENVAQGSMSLNLNNHDGYAPMPVDERYEFSHADKDAYIFVMWDPKLKAKPEATMQIYDLDNRMMLQSKAEKLSFKPGQVSYSMWKLGLATVPPGTYRVDVWLNNEPAWRSFFRVSQ